MITPGMQARTEFGQLLKAARVGGRLTQAELGARAGTTQVKIARLESGQTTAPEELVDRIIAAFDVAPAQATRLRSAWVFTVVGDLGQSRQAPKYALDLMRLERVAVELLCWHELRIPGPIQSDRYMRAQFDAAGRDVTPAAVARGQRRDLFTGPHLRRYHCVLYEEALHRAAHDFGGEVAADQVDWLLAMIDGPEADRRVIQVVPREVALPDLRGDATILLFDPPQRNRVYLEHIAGGLYLNKQDEVDTAVDRWRRRLVPHALDAAGTAELLRRLRKDFSGARPSARP